MKFYKQKIHVAMTQINTVLGDIDKNLEKHYSDINKAIEEKNDIIVFPELSLTGYSLKDAVYDVAVPANDTKFNELKKLSKHISIMAGMVELNDRYEIYNTALFFENGELLTRHRKVYLPTYGVFEEERYFSSGNRFRAFDSKFGRFGLLICEDIWHPTSGVILAQDGASVLLVSSAALTRGIDENPKPENVRTWETLLQALAITSTSYVAFANRVGVEDGLVFWGGSALIAPDGNMINRAPFFKEEMITTEIDMLKLKHARLNTTLLSDEKLPVLIDEFSRIYEKNKEY